MNKMKFSVILFFVLTSVIGYCQTNPLNSIYNQTGPYTIDVDSNYSSNPAFLIYKPNNYNGNQKLPVIVFQPGANGFFSTAINVHSYDLYMKHFASWGYVVLVLDVTTAGFPSSSGFKTVVDWVYQNCANQNHWMNQLADTNNIVIGGHSNGGVNASAYIAEFPNKVKGVMYFASYPSSFPATDVSTHTGYLLDIAGSEDNSSTPTTCKQGYNAYTNAICKSWVLIHGMGHGGFGDYFYSQQPVGSIGRDSATAIIRHLVLSYFEANLKQNSVAEDQFFNSQSRPGNIDEFETNCILNSQIQISEHKEKEVVIYNQLINNPNNYKIEIFDALGKLLLIETKDKFCLNNLDQGILIIKITSGKGFYFKKVVNLN